MSTMKGIEAHELLSADRGVEIVLTTAGQFTYVGWFVAAREIDRKFVGAVLDDFQGLRVTAILPHRHHLHIRPFEQLAVGDLVVRAGYDDPDHRNYRRADLGQVERIARDSEKNRVYSVLWEGETDARWHTRRMLTRATEQQIEEIRQAVKQP